MRHHDWQDLIPYYIAGTLDSADTAALERHLARCSTCRAAASEWRDIAGLVHAEASAWAAETPPLSESLRAALIAGPLLSSNGHEQLTVPVHPITDPDAHASHQRTARPRVRVPLTLAAVFAVLLAVGALMVYIGTRGNDTDPDTFGDGAESAMLPTFTPEDTLDAASATPRPSRTPANPSPMRPPNNTPLVPDDLGIMPLEAQASEEANSAETAAGIMAATPTPLPAPLQNTCSAIAQGQERVPVYNAPYSRTAVTWLEPGAYNHVITTNAARDWYQVYVTHAGRAGWVYSTGVKLLGQCSNLPIPTPTHTLVATPTAVFHYQVGGGYHLITTQPINGIPQETRVRITSAWYDGGDWVYAIQAQDGRTGEARTWQLSVAPAGPTPTSSLDLSGWGGYEWLTTTQVGSLSTNTRVAIGSAWFTGEEWIYQIVTKNGRSAEARAWQLTQSPDPDATPTPTFYATPTAQFHDQIGIGFNLLTVEAIGNLPPDTRVRISSATYDGTYWHYTVVPQYDPAETAHAYSWQLKRAPQITATPSPQITPTAVFYNFVGKDWFRLQTVEQVGPIPAGSWVQVISMRYDGRNWRYTIATADNLAAEATTSQLRYPPPTATPTPSATWTPSPTYTPTRTPSAVE